MRRSVSLSCSIMLLVFPAVVSAQESLQVLFRPQFQPEGGGPIVSIEAIRATTISRSNQGVPVVLRRGSVGSGGNPADRFGAYERGANFLWPSDWLKKWATAIAMTNPANALATTFEELQPEATWQIVNRDETPGPITAFVIGKTSQFVFDSPAQFYEIARPGPGQGSNVPPPGVGMKYVLFDELDALNRDIFKGGASEAVLTCSSLPNECLFVCTIASTSGTFPQLMVLALPRNSTPPEALPSDPRNRDYWTPDFAMKAFGTTGNCVLYPEFPSGDRWKYEKYRTLAYCPVNPDEMTNQFAGFRHTNSGQIQVRPWLEWKLQDAAQNARGLRFWTLRNEYQKKYVVVEALAKDLPIEQKLGDLGRKQVGFGSDMLQLKAGKTDGQAVSLEPLVPTRIGSLHAYHEKYYPEVFETTPNNVFELNLRFHLVKESTNAAPFYLLENELTVRQFLGLLKMEFFNEDVHWRLNTKREQYGIALTVSNSSSIATTTPAEVMPRPESSPKQRFAAWAKREYDTILNIAALGADGDLEAQFAAWLFDIKWKQLEKLIEESEKEAAWKRGRAVYEFAQLRNLFLSRWLQQQETKAASKGGRQDWDAYRSHVVDLASGLGTGVDLEGALKRYQLQRTLFQPTGFQLNKDLSPLDEPLSWVSPDTIQNLLTFHVLFNLPTSTMLRRAGEQVTVEPTGIYGKPWPVNLITLRGNFQDLRDNVSEVVLDNGAYGFYGGNYRASHLDGRTVPMSSGVSSSMIGYRLALLSQPDVNPPVAPSAIDGTMLDKLYTEIWGSNADLGHVSPWQEEHTFVSLELGQHQFWQIEHLRAVLCGAHGYISDGKVADQQPDSDFITLIYRIIYGVAP